MARLCVTVVTYHRLGFLQAVLDSIAEQTFQPSEVVIVDNAGDPEVQALVQAHPSLGEVTTYLPMPENIGPAGGTAVAMNHFVARYDDDDWLMRLDDDRPAIDDHLFADFVEFGVRWSQVVSSCAGVGMAGARWDPQTATLSRVAVPAGADGVEVDYLATGWFATFRRSAIAAAGPMDAELFFGLSEVEFGLRLRKHGFSLWLHGPRVYERRKARDGAANPSVRSRTVDIEADWRRYYSLRNSIYIARRYGGIGPALSVTVVRVIGKPILNLALSPSAAWSHLVIGMRAAMDAWLGRMGKRIDPVDWERRHGRLVDGELPAT